MVTFSERAALALVGTEAQRGVALDVLHRLEAFAGRQFDGGGGDVVLQVDKLLGCPCRGFFVRHLEQGQGRLLKARQGLGQRTFHRGKPGFAGGTYAPLKAVGQ